MRIALWNLQLISKEWNSGRACMMVSQLIYFVVNTSKGNHQVAGTYLYDPIAAQHEESMK